MKKRVIKVELSQKGIDKAIKELNDYKKWLKDCTEKFLKALADEGAQIATAKFQRAVYDGTNCENCSSDLFYNYGILL